MGTAALLPFMYEAETQPTKPVEVLTFIHPFFRASTVTFSPLVIEVTTGAETPGEACTRRPVTVELAA